MNEVVEPGSDDEQRLIADSRRGSADAFARLVLTHQAAVRAYVAHFVRAWDRVDDLAQETFLGAFRNLDSYRGDAPLRIWLLGVARRQVLGYLRREMQVQARHSRLQAELTALTAVAVEREVEGGNNQLAEYERRAAALSACIEDLPPASATLFSGFYRAEQSIAELSRVLQRNEGAIKVALFRMRQALRVCIERRLALGVGGGVA